MADMSPKVSPTEGDQDRRATLLAVVTSVTLLSTTIVLLRVYSRVKFIHHLGWDDYTIIMAQVMRLHFASIAITYMFADFKPPRHDFNH